tara:strand:+ start:534 stop:917 length:384 start_codon:yes stop_codon:yes gene_type:complete
MSKISKVEKEAYATLLMTHTPEQLTAMGIECKSEGTHLDKIKNQITLIPKPKKNENSNIYDSGQRLKTLIDEEETRHAEMNKLARSCNVTLQKQVKELDEESGKMKNVEGKFEKVHPQFHNKIVTSY